MRHEILTVAPDAHPAWCECRVCGPRRGGAAEDIRDTIRCFVAGLIVAIPACGTVIVVHFWPAIAAAARSL